jgi:DnaJ homolog subfamily C member 19
VTKLVLLAVIVVLGWRLVSGRWLWEARRLSPRSAERDRARVLLGVATGASREDIIEAHRRLIALVHPDRGGHAEQVHEANDARDLLLAEAGPRKPELP